VATDPDRRTQLAIAAYEVVAESGMDRLSLRTVARRVGATTGIVSHHFSDRRDLVAAALDHAVAVMFRRTLDLPTDPSPFDLLVAVLPTDPSTVEVWRFSISVRAAGLFDPELRQFDRTIRGYWDDSLPTRLDGAVTGDPIDAARHLVAVVDGIALNAVLDPQRWPPEAQLRHLRIAIGALTGATEHPTANTDQEAPAR
jgi:TetR/AcrR family transcriptional regulator, transcriptional repressor of bet genes